jgi:hypothetical protein
MRLLYLPWSHLTPEEQETATREARRRGALGARVDLWRYQMDRGDAVPTARPILYVYHVLVLTPPAWRHAWRRMGVAELCAEMRVCHFGDGWERERRSLAEEPPLPRDVPTLALRVTEAQAAWTAARADHHEHARALCRRERLPLGHPDRLAMGAAMVQAIRARDDYWLAVMLARAAGWEPHAAPWNGPTEERR